jgi:hypothetical protein
MGQAVETQPVALPFLAEAIEGLSTVSSRSPCEVEEVPGEDDHGEIDCKGAAKKRSPLQSILLSC